jgi:hypothetical protein
MYRLSALRVFSRLIACLTGPCQTVINGPDHDPPAQLLRAVGVHGPGYALVYFLAFETIRFSK